MPRVPFVDPVTLPPDKRSALAFSAIQMKYVLAHATDTFVPFYQAIGTLRSSPEFDPLLRQMVILAAAAATGSEYLWSQHEARTVALGATAEQIEALRARRPFDAPQSAVVTFLHDLYEGRGVDDERVEEVLSVVTVRGFVESMLQYGLYLTCGRMIEAVDLPLQDPVAPANWDLLYGDQGTGDHGRAEGGSHGVEG